MSAASAATTASSAANTASVARTTAATSASTTNTYPVVTTTAPQVVPSSTSSAKASGSNSTFPVAAIAVIAIFGGFFLIFVAYRVYVWSVRRGRFTPPPDARPAFVAPVLVRGGSDEKGSFRSPSSLGGGGGLAAVGAGRRENSWSGEGSPGPASRSGSDDSPASGSNLSHSSLPSHHGMNTAGSRSSMASSNGFHSQPRRFHGSNSIAQNGLRLAPEGRPQRLSGAPHNPHTRVEIVPPLPLGPPPGSVVATDKSTLDFAPTAGIGQGLSAPEMASRRDNDWQTGRGIGAEQQQQQQQYLQQPPQAYFNASSSGSAGSRRDTSPGSSQQSAGNVEKGFGSPLDQLQARMNAYPRQS